MTPGVNRIMYGGDYNPEQWSATEWYPVLGTFLNK